MSSTRKNGQFLTPQVRRVDDYLSKRGLEDRVILIEKGIRTAAQTAQALGVAMSAIAKTLVLLVDGEPILVILPGDKKIDFKQIKAITKAKEIRLASPAAVIEATGFDIGGVSPVAHKTPLSVFIDNELSGNETIYAAAGSDHAVFRTSHAELLAITNGTRILLSKGEAERHYWVDPEARSLGVKFQVAEIHSVTVRTENPALEESKEVTVKRLINTDIESEPILGGYRDLFARAGLTGAVSSPEALLRFVVNKHKFPHVNTVVDSYNEKSAEQFIVASAHDLAKIEGDVRIVMSTGQVDFYPIGRKGKSEKPPPTEWIGVDDNHVLCRLNCKQSELSKVTLRTSDLLVYVQGNRLTTEDYLKESLVEICKNIIKYNGGEFSLLDEKEHRG